MSAPLIKKRLDDYAGSPFCYFDEDSKVIFIAGKGESAVSFYQFSTESPNYVDFLFAYKGKEAQKGFSFLPKRVVDVLACEIARGVRMTAKTVEYVQFKVPRKSGTFQADLFPPCKSNEPAMKFEEYWTGVDKEPLKQEMTPDNKDHLLSPQRRSNFLAKLDKNQSEV
jgi:coronin-1B/1C/6